MPPIMRSAPVLNHPGATSLYLQNRNPLFFIKLPSLEYYIIATENRLQHSDSREVLVCVEP